MILPASLALFFVLSTAEPLHLPLFRRSVRELSPRDHFVAVARTLARYGSTSTADVLQRDDPQGVSQELGLGGNPEDASYYLPVEFGTPGQTLNLMVGTASSDILVASTACSSSAGCPKSISLYDPSKSSTAINKSTSTTTISYGSGDVVGYLLNDNISMGVFSVSAAPFLSVIQQSNNIIGTQSGLLGLAFGGIADTTTVPFWQAIINNNEAVSPEMGFWLSRKSGGPAGGGGFTFGGVNPLYYSGDIDFLSLTGTASKFWSLDVSAITVQGVSVSVNSSTALAAFDTASNAIFGPETDVQAIWAAVPGASVNPKQAGTYQFPCSTSVNITVSFGGKVWPIDPADMNFGPVSDGSSQCLGAIFGSDSGVPIWIFGTPFLTNVYSVLRQNPPAVGFAELSTAAGGTGTSNSSSTPPRPSSAISASSTPGGPSSTPTSCSGHCGKKSGVGAIVGGAIGGIAVVLLVLAFLLYHRRRQNGTSDSVPTTVANKPPPAPLSFVVDKEEPGPIATSSPNSPSSRRPRPQSSLSTMKRNQTAAVHRYGDRHTADDFLLQTEQGLQLSPGSVSSTTSSATSPNNSLRPTSDPMIVEELQNLRKQVTRLEAERAPPGYINPNE
ncbi:aspartic peptidase domain-containing protein [Mycena rebaudengoi]|nr:aspartic peptidase domain-containing protein [Mycena rebaudengoi]